MTNFIHHMTAMRDRLLDSVTPVGLPNMRSLTMKVSKDGVDLFVDMGVFVVREINDSDERLEGINSVSGKVKAFEVKGISRNKFTRQQLEYEGISYYLDGNQDGICCNLVEIKENTLTWDIKLLQQILYEQIY